MQHVVGLHRILFWLICLVLPAILIVSPVSIDAAQSSNSAGGSGMIVQLLRNDLSMIRGELVAIESAAIVLNTHRANGETNRVEIPRAETLALMTDRRLTDRRSGRKADAGVLARTDGQVFPGHPVERTDQRGGTETLEWHHAWLGQLSVELDDISRVVFQPGAQPPTTGDADTLLLTNGDRIEGFLLSLSETIELEQIRDGSPEIVTLPRDRVAAVRLVNPVRPAGGTWAWFEDGTILRAGELSSEDGRWGQLTMQGLENGEQTVSFDALQAIVFDAGRLRMLTDLELISMDGPETRYRLPEPTIDRIARNAPKSVMTISGPIVLRYSLPAAATRFASEVRLPSRARGWADVHLTIRVDDEVIARHQIDASQPELAINERLRGSELTIELDHGPAGPIHTVLELHDPRLLIE
ncbi:MAG: hypothetical protein EA377_05840 [Phycisphaerales bacterium]|nr:MAG: hypothetical protein EA377_05840 [Phycisphaerales bacterium]